MNRISTTLIALAVAAVLLCRASIGLAGESEANEPTQKVIPANPPRDWLYTALELNYVFLNAADLMMTFKGLERGAREANPVARLFIRNKPLALAVKGGVTAGVLFGLAYVKKHDSKAAYISLGLLNVLYGVVVTNNVSVYLRL